MIARRRDQLFAKGGNVSLKRIQLIDEIETAKRKGENQEMFVLSFLVIATIDLLFCVLMKF